MLVFIVELGRCFDVLDASNFTGIIIFDPISDRIDALSFVKCAARS